MRLLDIIYADFTNYKKTSMFLGTITCDWKCCDEQNIPRSVCQNSKLISQKVVNIKDDEIARRYMANLLAQSIVIGGLEPFMQYAELVPLIRTIREYSQDSIVIYTGYNETELTSQIKELAQFKNIIIKFGRFLINSKPVFDDVLGVTLASSNQYAKQIS